jgi:hypothetical protein
MEERRLSPFLTRSPFLSARHYFFLSQLTATRAIPSTKRTHLARLYILKIYSSSMPKLLKKILSTSTMSFVRRKQQQEIDLIATPPSTSPASPTGSKPSYSGRDTETKLDMLAERVMQKLRGKGININTLGKEQLVDILRGEGTQAGDSTTTRAGQRGKDRTAPAKEGLTGPRAQVYPASRRAGDDGQTVIHAVVGCIGKSTCLKWLTGRRGGKTTI